MRWGEETSFSFRDLKYTLDLLHFHAKKRQYVEQEIYAGLVRFNFCGAIANHVDPPAPRKNKERKYDYKICFLAAVSICLEYMKRDPDFMNPCLLITARGVAHKTIVDSYDEKRPANALSDKKSSRRTQILKSGAKFPRRTESTPNGSNPESGLSSRVAVRELILHCDYPPQGRRCKAW